MLHLLCSKHATSLTSPTGSLPSGLPAYWPVWSHLLLVDEFIPPPRHGKRPRDSRAVGLVQGLLELVRQAGVAERKTNEKWRGQRERSAQMYEGGGGGGKIEGEARSKRGRG